MIEFIIIDEDKKYLKLNKELIEKVLMNKDYSYKIYEYSNLNNIEINKDKYKIYIIDYNNKTLKIMNHIRHELNDWTSMIIITTSSKIETLYNKRIMPIDVVTKDNNYKYNLNNCLLIALTNYDNRPNTIKYNYKNTYYNINLNEIIYIEKEKDNKRCTIKTKEEDFPILGNLNTIEKLLDKRFIKSSRSYLINMEQLKSFNTKDNIIVFKDGTEIYEVSRNKKKDIINYLRGIY